MNYTGLEQIAGPPEETIYGRLGFVFGLAARWKEQRLSCGILDRLIGAIVQNLQHAD